MSLKTMLLCALILTLFLAIALLNSRQVLSEPADSPLFSTSLNASKDGLLHDRIDRARTDHPQRSPVPDRPTSGEISCVGSTCDITCGVTCSGWSCDPTCDNTCGATYCGSSCFVSICGVTCEPTCEASTCVGLTCQGTCSGDPTCDATCASTCAVTCSGATCETTCEPTCGPDIEIELMPHTYPIIIPATGGQFAFDITVTSNADSTITTTVWCDIRMPDSTQSTVLGPLERSFDPGSSVMLTLAQVVPQRAPAGDYVYWAFVGDYPLSITDSDSFAFSKEGTCQTANAPLDWTVNGNLPGQATISYGQTTSGRLRHVLAHPNPFNQSVTLSFTLDLPSSVRLRIYDTTGRTVKILVEGWYSSGTYQFVWNTTNDAGHPLPSGMYFYRLQTGEINRLGKLLLIK